MNNTRISFCSDQGPRENLEDALGALNISIPVSRELDFTLAIVADGVGGNNYGEIASNQAVNNIKSFLAASLSVITPTSNGNSIAPDTIIDLLIEALNAANDAICQQATEQPILKGMSTTIVCSLIVNDILYIAWAGDSRCYLYSKNKIRQITVDHCVVQQLIDDGLLDCKYAKSHPLAHTINQFLGMEDNFAPETATCKLSRGDVMVVCSDGLTDVIDDENIADSIRKYQNGTLSFKCLPKYLVQDAITSGTTDNVTVLCCEYLGDLTTKQQPADSTLTGTYPAKVAQILQSLNKESTNA